MIKIHHLNNSRSHRVLWLLEELNAEYEISYFAGLYANPAASSFTNDLIVVVAAFFVWSFVETGRLKMSYGLWAAIFVFTFVIAAAMTVPLFMLLRERRLIAMAK